MRHVGILALQGDVGEHEAALRAVGVAPVRVRRPAQLDTVDGLILPGGESTTIGRLVVEYGFVGALQAFLSDGRPVWGTCAGLILLARGVERDQALLGGLDIQVIRNGFGRQVDSFEADLAIPALGPPPFRGVFIRAPVIAAVQPGVEVLARLADGQAVAVRQGSVLGTSFHAELTDDPRLHRYFLALGRPPARAARRPADHEFAGAAFTA